MTDTLELKVQHSSLQFSDKPRQQKRDIFDLFAEGEDCPIKTGDEAGADETDKNENRKWLEHFAEEFNHRINFARDNWVAVDRAIAKPRSFVVGGIFIADNKDMHTRGQDRVMATMQFDHVNERVGRIYQGAVHYPTQGAFPNQPNYEINVLYADKIAEWMRRVGRGSNIALVNGDFNMPDDKTDWAFGRDFTSMADELGKHPNTGHGPIDGMVSYNKDGRITAKSFKVLNDEAMFQFSDHFVCRGIWTVRLLPEAN